MIFLAYFPLVIICCIFENPRMIAILAVVAPFAYAGFFFKPGDHHPGSYLQLVFLFVVSLFYGHFSQLVALTGYCRSAPSSAALGAINPAQADALGKVLRQTASLASMVDVILSSASVETGAVAVHREELVFLAVWTRALVSRKTS